ncbi:Calx-beta domain-containing protein [Fodinibius salsisoli]|uniref:DUF4843 domain-containing protein n=1 Tax=Fodinibius salsisoli TaxID=2820877 RepID=A0ABT3PNZ8_9BACT|nr:Calx-beta domain-containing protein [Fodinibius salsisoli]MCW9707581.1 DUF4843 domain-containing protein [Fodinibius salsisoli]
MKKRTAYNILSVLLVSLFLTGCLNDLFEQEDQTYQGEAKLEFRPQTDTFDEDEGEVEVLIQLIGAQRDNDVSVNFLVDEETTAEAGTHYELLSTSPVTIPANSSSAAVTINLDGNSLPEGEIRTLFLRLENRGDVEPAQNLDTYELTIEGVE